MPGQAFTCALCSGEQATNRTEAHGPIGFQIVSDDSITGDGSDVVLPLCDTCHRWVTDAKAALADADGPDESKWAEDRLLRIAADLDRRTVVEASAGLHREPSS